MGLNSLSPRGETNQSMKYEAVWLTQIANERRRLNERQEII